VRRPAYHPLPTILVLPLGLLAAAIGYYAILVPHWMWAYVVRYPVQAAPLEQAEVPAMVTAVAVVAGVCGAVALVGAIAGLFRWRWGLVLLRKGYLAAYVVLVLALYLILKGVGASMPGANSYDVSAEAWSYAWPVVLGLPVILLLHVLSWRRATIGLYTGAPPAEPTLGDRILENVRTHGRDPPYRKSILTSAGVHALALIGPLLLEMVIGCVSPYRVPHGRGTASVAQVQFIQKKKKKPKTFILNPNAAIYFQFPDLEDSEVRKQVEEESQLTYAADVNAVHGAMGAGGGKEGGWPEGTGRDPIRFIRLKYDGQEWDDGMDSVSRADLNFLEEFQRLTGLKTARSSEAHAIRLLEKYDKGFAPPFVYMTGEDRISVSSRDLKVLRDYCLDGGMLFADCGSQRWDSAFRAFVRAVFPDKDLLVIADDDPIFQQPYQFANGAPPLWHHGGKRALGIKHKNRWCVFYHPGDVNDAWKTGHTGLEPAMAKGAFQMGVNIIYYAFTHYLEETKKYRK
jgi:hypothetical protein